MLSRVIDSVANPKFSVATSARRFFVAALLCGMMLVCGCGSSNPIPVLRDAGATVKLNRNRQITEISFPASATDADLLPLANIEEPETVNVIDLAGTEISDANLGLLRRFEKLQRLELNDTAITDEGLAKLTGSFEPADDATEEEKAAAKEQAELPGLLNLNKLSLGGTAVTDAGLLEHLPRFGENLDIVDLSPPREPEKPEGRTLVTALNFGIDLAGGTNLVYQVDRKALESTVRDELRAAAIDNGEDPASIVIDDSMVDAESTTIINNVMEQMVGAVGRRLNPSGVEEITVRKVGQDRIEVIMPKASPEEIERKKSEMTRLGSLEFAILANRRDHAEIRERIGAKDDLFRPDGSLEASWREWAIGQDGVSKGSKDNPDANGEVYAEGNRYLVVFGTRNERVTGQYLKRVYQTSDEGGRLAVGFNFNTQGATKFAALTSANKPDKQFERRLAILLDDKINSAPSLQAVISDTGTITGRFSKEEVDELINVLNAGALTVPIDPVPISEQTVSAGIGIESREKGLWAIAVAGLSVVVFMLLYYRFAGVVANMCLLLNIVLMMGIMALIDATFSLPGLAGIVLTIGMAVDANVLIFERIREERKRGSSARMAIQNGFDRAFTTIVDANMTTLITAVVLYMIGTDQVRGFAVTLFIGIVMSMFTALYFGRMVFEICERKRWIKEPIGAGVFSAPGWDFIGKRKIAAVLSALVIIGGMAVFVMRGADNYDIDFSGGTMLTVELTEAREFTDVKKAMDTAKEPGRSITVERLEREGEDTKGEQSRFFRIRTNDTSTEAVGEMVRTAMTTAGYKLKSVALTYDVEEPASPETSDDPPAAPPEDTDFKVALSFDQPINKSKLRTVFGNGLNKIEREGAEGQMEPVYDDPTELFALKDIVSPEFVKDEAKSDETGDEKKARENLVVSATVVVDQKVSREHLDQTLASIQTSLSDGEFEGVGNFASSVAGEMRQSAVMAMLVSLIAIVGYIWFRFQRITFGLAAVAALVHDVLVVLGVVALASYASAEMGITALKLEDFKINLPMIAAFLTIVGYSLNDTIVVFDRIREVRGKNPALTEGMINTSLNQTLARTLLTSITTLLVVSILYWFGGEGIHGFAFCLVLGVMVGTYSSVYVASPVLLWLMNRDDGHRTAGKAAAPAVAKTT